VLVFNIYLASSCGPRFHWPEDPMLDESERVHVHPPSSLVFTLLEPLTHDIMAKNRRNVLAALPLVHSRCGPEQNES
jgi:hypothetical protein